jgi:prepilin-type N-terminal cleavage/methylation domain-containing protein/prepilin-type processing-associated H-X9-DG protein
MRKLHPSPQFRGFTLVELMVVTALLAVISLLVLALARASLRASRQAQCMGNLRNLGGALHLYATDHDGRFPETTHTAGLEGAWVYALEPYLGDFDESRICPEDPQRRERLRARGTSYVLNSYLFVPETDPFGEPVGPALTRLNAVPDPARTLLAFICSDTTGTGPGNDHTHSNQWSSWAAVCRDISPDRFADSSNANHTRGKSNYLYADGRVETMHAAEVKQRIDSGINIAVPPGIDFPQ